MRVTSLVVRLTRPLAVILVTAIVAGGIVAGARLTAGNPAPEPFTPQLAPGDPPPSITPRPGTPNPGPSPLNDFGPPPDTGIADNGATPPPWKVGSVDVPIPPGAELIVTGQGIGGGRPSQRIVRGNSWVRFDMSGIIDSHVEPEDKSDFDPTMQALEQLSSKQTQ